MAEKKITPVARSRAAEFARDYTAEYHPQLGSRRRYEHEAGSRYALDAMRVLASTRSGMPRLIETYPHTPMEPPLRRMQYHGVWRFNDGSQLGVYDQAFVIANRSEDVIRITASKQGPIFGGAWDGGHISDLLLSIRDIAARFGITADRQALIRDITKTLSIPHQVSENLAAHPYNQIAPVIAMDAGGRVLVRHEQGLTLIPGSAQELARAEAQNNLEAKLMSGIAPDQPVLPLYNRLAGMYRVAGDILRDIQVAITQSLPNAPRGPQDPSWN